MDFNINALEEESSLRSDRTPTSSDEDCIALYFSQSYIAFRDMVDNLTGFAFANFRQPNKAVRPGDIMASVYRF